MENKADLNKQQTKKIWTIVLTIIVIKIIIPAVIVLVVLHCVLKVPDLFGIQRKKEYDRLKSNPPDDLCQLETDYDGFEKLPDEMIVEGKTFYRVRVNWRKGTGDYLGKMLVKYSDNWRTVDGFGYVYETVYSAHNESDEIIALYLTADGGPVYVRFDIYADISSLDVFTIELETSSGLFSDCKRPIIMNEIIDKTGILSDGIDLSSRVLDTKGIDRESDNLYFLTNRTAIFFSMDYTFIEWQIPFYLYRGDFYLQLKGDLYKITDNSVISKLNETVEKR